MRGHRDLELAVRGAILCALAALILPLEALRVVFALPLALFLPGYAIAAASFARRPLSGPPLLLLSIALSLCVLALGALPLNYVPGGVRELSWALLLLLVILNGCRLAALRRQAPRARRDRRPGWRPRRVEALLIGGGVLAALAALVLAMTPLPAGKALGYTELWITTRSSQPSGGIATIGVRSQEKRAVSYFLRVRFDKRKATVQLFDLHPGERRIIPVPAPPARRPLRVTASLFRQAQPTKIYRRVVAMVPGPNERR